MDNVAVSVMMLTYNRERYIGEAIDSVLLQSFSDWELIVIDDVSTDNTKAIVDEYARKDPRIKYFLNEKKSTIAESRNRALGMAAGKYIAVLDSDDVWADDDKLRMQFDFLENHKECILVGGNVIEIDASCTERRRYGNAVDDKLIREKMLCRNQFLHSSVMFPRAAGLSAGGYRTDVKIGEEYDLWLRLGLVGKLANLNSYLVKYRIHGGSISASARIAGALDHLRIIKDYRGRYPGFYRALFKAYFRVIYSLLLICRDRLGRGRVREKI